MPPWLGHLRFLVAKRVMDLVGASILLVVLAPVLAVVSAAILIGSGRPILHRQQRVGRDEVPFVMLKFRTMVVGASDQEHRAWNEAELRGEAVAQRGLFKPTSDPRVTAVGRVLRRYSLDELPQLLNVLRGEMSLVGPRPSLVWEHQLFDPRLRSRTDVKPGLTGLWQVSGRSRLAMPQMLELDLRYVEHQSLSLDLRILARTLPAVLRATEAA